MSNIWGGNIMFKEDNACCYIQLVKANQKGRNIINIKLSENNNLKIGNCLENLEDETIKKSFKILDINEIENGMDIEAPLFCISSKDGIVTSSFCLNYPDVLMEDVLLYRDNKKNYMLFRK